jgi:uncharacterized metal-binding protein YceD (DUF177 family)
MTEPEFSRPVRVEPLPRDGLARDIEATPAERAALAKLNGLPEIASLTAKLNIVKWRRGVRVEGAFSARLTQTCVVSLEPFEVAIDEPIDAKFLPAAADRKPAAEVLVGEGDEADEIVDGRIDLGALVAEFLTLALDPYPRKPGAAFVAAPEETRPETPFAALRAISNREEPD